MLLGRRLMPAATVGSLWGPWALYRGDGLFETVGGEDGTLFLWEEHRERLRRSAMELYGLDPALPGARAIARLLEAENRGMGPVALRLFFLPGDRHGASFAWVERARIPKRERREGVELEPFVLPTTALSHHKLASYGQAMAAWRWAKRQGAHGVLLIDPGGFIRETATANVFVVFADRVVTPPAPGRALPGVIRAYCMSKLRQSGVHVSERDVTLQELALASGVFLTSSVAGLVPVRRVGPLAFPTRPWVLDRLLEDGFPAPGYRRRKSRTRSTPRKS